MPGKRDGSGLLWPAGRKRPTPTDDEELTRKVVRFPELFDGPWLSWLRRKLEMEPIEDKVALSDGVYHGAGYHLDAEWTRTGFDWDIIEYDTVDFDTDGFTTPADGSFEVPIHGVYVITMTGLVHLPGD